VAGETLNGLQVDAIRCEHARSRRADTPAIVGVPEPENIILM
jgi:hypothetical protein